MFEKILGQQDTPIIIAHKKVFDVINHQGPLLKRPTASKA